LYINQKDGTLVPKQYSNEYLSLMGFASEKTDTDCGEIFFHSIHPDDKDGVIKSLGELQEDAEFHNEVFRVQIKNVLGVIVPPVSMPTLLMMDCR
jgi:hypothetical protein